MTWQHVVIFLAAHRAAVFIGAAVALVAGVSLGCAMLRSVDKNKLAYDAANLATAAYFAEQSKFDPAIKDAVAQAYDAFAQGIVKADPATIADFPAMIKREYTSKIPDAGVRAKADGLIDTYWAKVNAVVVMAGMSPTEIIALLNAVKEGIDAGIKANAAK